MKLNIGTAQAVRGGAAPVATATHKTTLNNTIFKIVTEGLYIKPIDAIVRELCTNALDAHIVEGKADLPFEVTLPSRLNPNFIVRDFGCSMSQDTIFNIYGVLGESTKNLSSTEIGGWGVGGKSPAAYTDTFYITTFLDGKRSIYQSTHLPDKNPLELMLTGDYDAPKGTEVKVPVKEQDFDRFRQAFNRQLSFFDVKPKITNYPDEEYEYAYSLETEDVFEANLTLPNNEGVLTKQHVTLNYHTNCGLKQVLAVRMGCVHYPINSTSEIYSSLEPKLKFIKQYSGKGSLLITLPVDSVDIKPSREDLNYTDRTNTIIKEMVNSLYKKYRKGFIQLVLKLRKLTPLDVLKNINTLVPDADLAERILTTRTGYCRILKRRFGYVNYLHELRHHFRKVMQSETSVSWYDLQAYDDGKVKKVSSLSLAFIPDPDREITLILKSSTYIKKTEYCIEEGLLPPSGLVTIAGSYYQASHYGHVYRHNANQPTNCIFIREPKCDAPYLVVSQTQANTLIPFLEKYFKKVNLFKLPPLPKTFVSSSYSSKRTAGLYWSYRTLKADSSANNYSFSRRTQYTGAYSFKSFNTFLDGIKENANEELIPILYSRNDSSLNTVLAELAHLSNKKVVLVYLPDGFKERLLSKDSLNCYMEEDFIQECLSNLPVKVKNTIIEIGEQLYLKAALINKSDSYGDRAKQLIHYINRSQPLKEHFFPFIKLDPRSNKFKYPSLANHLFNQSKDIKSRSKYLDFVVNEWYRRMLLRSSLILRRKRTLWLVRAGTETVLVEELFKLNFKGVFNEN